MFTGIVEDRGVVISSTAERDSMKLILKTALDTAEIKLGDSICVNGVCVTVIKIDGSALTFDVSFETVEVTNLKGLKSNDHVNIERALKANGRFDGHIVSGHIDGTGRIASKERAGNFFKLRIEAGESILKYIVKKGSIAVDGISLTVNSVDDKGFDFVVIPHTLQVTVLETKGVNDIVNLENDVLAKYVEKLVKYDDKRSESKVDARFLAEHGFI